MPIPISDSIPSSRLVTGVRFKLSPSHPLPDICDAITGANLGYGMGVYPMESMPSYPFHPNCDCDISYVTIDIPKKINTNNLNDSLIKFWKETK
jgi:hypothetical protein